MKRSESLKSRWKRWRARPGTRRAVRGQLQDGWPEVCDAYRRLRMRGLSDREAINQIVTVLEREGDRMVDAWRRFDRAAYAADLANVGA